MDWRDEILRESAQIAELAKNPTKINRVGKSRRTLCEGGCGRRVWGDFCRKCRRQRERNNRKKRSEQR